MAFNRRELLGLAAGAAATPGIMWSTPAHAATRTIKLKGSPVSLVAPNGVNQSEMAVCAAGNGRFAAAWRSPTGTLQVRVYGPDCKPVAPLTQLSSTHASPGVALAANPDGSCGLFWTYGIFPKPDDIRYQPLSATGVPQHAPYVTNGHANQRADFCCAARLKSGNFAVAYRSGAQDFDADIAYAVISPVGAIIHKERLLYKTSEQEHPVGIVGLTGGGFVLALRLQSTPASSVLFKLQAFDVSGNSVGAPMFLTSRHNWGGVDMRIGLTALANGGFAAFWRESTSTINLARLRGTFFNAARVAGASVNIALPLTNESGSESCDALECSPGNVLVAVESGLNAISAAVFDAAGNTVAQVTRVAGLPSDPLRDNRSGPGLVKIGATRFVLTFSENSPNSSDFLLGRAQIVDLV